MFIEYEWDTRLRYVRIFFDTPTFDRITKDRAAKFVDMLSAIGGTMGLLTGFSIISGVEIVYFASKILVNIFKKKKRERMPYIFFTSLFHFLTFIRFNTVFIRK